MKASAETVVEPVPGVFRIASPFAGRVVCSYLVRGERADLLLDTGVATTPRETLLPAFAEIGVDLRAIRYVVNSHADVDHAGGNGVLRTALPHAVFVCHRDDRRLIENVEAIAAERYDEFAADHGVSAGEAMYDWARASTDTTPIDVVVTGGETVALGGGVDLQVIHTPGHSSGHIALFAATSRTALIADAVLGRGVVDAEGSLVLPPTYRDVDAYLETIRLLEALRPETLLTGHYPVYRGEEVQRFLAESRAFTERFDLAVRQALEAAGEPRAARDLLPSLTAIGGWPEQTAGSVMFPLLGHLERLVARGVVDAVRAHPLKYMKSTRASIPSDSTASPANPSHERSIRTSSGAGGAPPGANAPQSGHLPSV